MGLVDKLRKRNSAVLKNVFASFFGVSVTLFNQILMIPVFLHCWGTQKYGDWIVLTSLVGFLTMTDIGLNSVTANQYSIRYMEGKNKECNSLLSNNYLMLFVLTIVVFISVLIYVLIGNVNRDFEIRVTNESVTREVLLILTLKIFIVMFSAVLNSVYRAASMSSKSIFLDNLGRFLETILLCIGVVLNWSLNAICLVLLLPYILLFFYKTLDTKKLIEYKIGISFIDIDLLRQILIPSFSFLSFPISNAFVSQGFTLVVNKYFGANSLVLFNTTRTMVNFIKQMVNVIAMSVWPELSLAYGNKNFSRMRSIHRNSVFISFIISIATSIIVMLLGSFIYRTWTNGAIQFNFGLMFSFLLVLLVNNGWYTSSMSLMATNKHSVLGVRYLGLSIISILILLGYVKCFSAVEYVPLCLLIVDFVLATWVFRKVFKLTNDDLGSFIFGIVQDLGWDKKVKKDSILD